MPQEYAEVKYLKNTMLCDLEVEVNYQIKKGFRIYGQIQITPTSFIQAMIKLPRRPFSTGK